MALHWPVIENGEAPGAADVAGEQRQIADSVHRGRAQRAVIHAHGPADEAGLGAAVQKRGLVEQLLAQAGDLGDALRAGSAPRNRSSSSNPVVWRVDVVAIDQAVPDQNVRDAVDQRQIRARLQGQMQIRHHGGLGDARIGHDQRLARIRVQVLAQNRMIVGDIRADQQNDVGALQIFVAPGGPSLPKDSL